MPWDSPEPGSITTFCELFAAGSEKEGRMIQATTFRTLETLASVTRPLPQRCVVHLEQGARKRDTDDPDLKHAG